MAHWRPLSTAAADDEVELQGETKGQRSETRAEGEPGVAGYLAHAVNESEQNIASRMEQHTSSSLRPAQRWHSGNQTYPVDVPGRRNV